MHASVGFGIRLSALIAVLGGAACDRSSGGGHPRQAPQDTARVARALIDIPTVTNSSNFNGTAIGAGRFIWFSSEMKVSGVGSQPVHLYFNHAQIQFTAGGTTFTLSVPESRITIDPAAAQATTHFDEATQSWQTVLPASWSGNAFLGGLAWPVPVNLPGGINPVRWSASFESDAAISVNWQWGAAVYSSLGTDHEALQIKPVDGSSSSAFHNSDPAGTPEAFKSFVIGGARGGGGSNYTGGLSGTLTVVPVQPCAGVTCPAPDQCHTPGICDVRSGVCSNPAKTNDTACSDGNACTQADTCQAGTCVGSNPVTCQAQDQCHTAGACDPATGACINPTRPDGSSCNDDDACTRSDSCQAGLCTGTDPVACVALDQCHQPGICDSATGTCSNPSKSDGTTCSDGNACTQSDTCQQGTCRPGAPVSCVPPPGCNQGGTCDPGSGACSPPTQCGGTCGNGITESGEDCDDGNVAGGDGCDPACHFEGCGNHQVDALPPPTMMRFAWTASGCSPTPADIVFSLNGTEVLRSQVPQSCDCGYISTTERMVTDPTLLALFRQAPPNSMTVSISGGSPCSQMLGWALVTVTSNERDEDTIIFESNPGDASRRENFYCDYDSGDSWVQFVCAPSTVDLALNLTEECDDGNRTAGDGCSPICTVEVCGNGRTDPGEACDDGNSDDDDACTNRCTVNLCYGVPCSGTLCEVASCNQDTGQCTVVPIPEGGACNDFDSCTQQDVCQNGECVGTNPVVCPPGPGDSCHQAAGICLFFSGACFYPAKPNGTTCDDGNDCTFSDVCDFGSCTGGQTVVCAAPSNQCETSACVPNQGCMVSPKMNGTTCNDGNACTRIDSCQAGACQGTDPVVCTSTNACHDAQCNPANGACFDTNKPDYTSCNDGNSCTQTDTCLGGSCVGRNPVICDPLDDCHQAGTCNPATGQCSASLPAPDGTSCEDGNFCTTDDRCLAGQCAAGTPTPCAPVAGCRVAPVCKPSTGYCTEPAGCAPCGNGMVDQGEQCDDGNEKDGDGCSAACVQESCGDGLLSWLPPRALELHWLGSSCDGAGVLILRVNGTVVFQGSVGLPDCGCTPAVNHATISDPALLRAFRDGSNAFQLETQGSGRLAWALLRVAGVDTVEVPLFDAGGGNDAVARRTNACAAGTQSGALQATVNRRLTLYEDCDDGNTVAGDGCSATCANESSRRPPCGDGRIDGSEGCDDGNTVSGDGCSSICQREP